MDQNRTQGGRTARGCGSACDCALAPPLTAAERRAAPVVALNNWLTATSTTSSCLGEAFRMVEQTEGSTALVHELTTDSQPRYARLMRGPERRLLTADRPLPTGARAPGARSQVPNSPTSRAPSKALQSLQRTMCSW